MWDAEGSHGFSGICKGRLVQMENKFMGLALKTGRCKCDSEFQLWRGGNAGAKLRLFGSH